MTNKQQGTMTDKNEICPGCGRVVYPLVQPAYRDVEHELWHWRCFVEDHVTREEEP